MRVPMHSFLVSVLCAATYAHVPTLWQQQSKRQISDFPYQTYQSTNLTNPIFQTAKSGAALGSGFLFLVPEPQPGIDVPLIITDEGELIWSSAEGPIFNLHVSQINGSSVLSYWTGFAATVGFGYGSVKILDTTYTELFSVCPRLGLYVPAFDDSQTTPECQGDLHESEITSDSTVLVSAYNVTRVNLKPVGGPKQGWIIDSQFHELDIATGKLLFSWKSLDHVPITKSIVPILGSGTADTSPYDFFHLNSVQKVAGGRYLVSGRNTAALYMIDTDGTIIWTFNGYDGGDFGLPSTISNGSHFDPSRNVQSPSSGMQFRLNTASKKATLLRRLHDPDQKLYPYYQGDYFPLPNGNTIVGFGSNPYIKEFGPGNNTDVRMTIQFGDGNNGNYRVYRQEWSATPATEPDVVADSKTGLGYVSWNGATEVSSYAIYSGKTEKSLAEVARVDKNGFETQFDLPNGMDAGGFIQVGAYSGEKLLRKSKVIRVKAG